MNERKLPVRIIKSIPFSKERPPGGGPPRNFFKKKEELSLRQRYLVERVNFVHEYFEESFERYPRIPHVSKVQLIGEAMAKCHRPTYLFSGDTCPVIGGGKLGLLFVRTELERLQNLKAKITEEPLSKTTRDKWKANMSAILDFRPFTEYDRLCGQTPESLIEFMKHDGRLAVKAKLFNFFDSEANASAKEGFMTLLEDLHLSSNQVGEYAGLEIWNIGEIDAESLRSLAAFPAIQELSTFPRYRIVHPMGKEALSISIPSPGSEDYPVVGFLDTGVPENHSLGPWIIKSTSFVDSELSNHSHGCCVAALLAMGHYLNDSLTIDDDFLKIVSVEILGNTDEDAGRVDRVYEDELIRRIEYYFRNSSSNPRIWNMSLGFPETCEFGGFSDLAVFLDRLQDRHDLLFVLPTGNYEEKPIRGWPPRIGDIEIQEMEDDPYVPPDYLGRPADCIRAITVGAIACSEREESLVKRNQPASYSRKGPGPSFVPKPEVVHFSGNVSILENDRFDCTDQGIKSLDDNEQVIDCVGTSFAAPLVSRNLALLGHYIEPEPSSLLLKALLVHNAKMLKAFGEVENLTYYVGFGLPSRAADALFCFPYETTLIFEDRIRPGVKLEYPFCWPSSLKQGNKIRGEVIATLVSRPHLDEAFGAEYIRADVRFSLLSRTITKGEEKWKGIVPEDPCRLQLRRRHESKLIREAFKWSPVKRYCAKFNAKESLESKIRIELFLREGPDMDTFAGSIDFALILTVRDPEKRSPVYDEIVHGLHSLGVMTDEIRLKGRIRERAV